MKARLHVEGTRLYPQRICPPGEVESNAESRITKDHTVRPVFVGFHYQHSLNKHLNGIDGRIPRSKAVVLAIKIAHRSNSFREYISRTVPALSSIEMVGMINGPGSSLDLRMSTSRVHFQAGIKMSSDK